MSKKKTNIQRTVVILLCVMVVLVGAVVSRILKTTDSASEPASAQLSATQRAELQRQGVFVRPEPQTLAAFRLSDEQAQVFDNARFEGQWSLVFLGYTYCPDICPTTLALFKQLQAGWVGSKLDGIQYVLLSADPERDTSARLAEYVHYFHADFVGVTGSVAAVDGLAKQLNSLFARVPVDNGNDYLIDHSANIMIINPAGQYHGFIRPPHSQQQIKAAMETLIAGY